VIRAIVTDIEGTTSSLSFVKDVLFPYAHQRLPGFVKDHHDDPAVRELLDAARIEIGANVSNDEVISAMLRWIDEDKKVTPLKSLQGLIWEFGFHAGDFQGHVYPDAHQQLQHWHSKGYKLYVFSSGSVYAQKLLFGHTEYGDLNDLFSGYFDTHIGQKKEPQAYLHILGSIGMTGEQVLFLSDIQAELDAAQQAQMLTGWLVRDGDLDASAAHPQFGDFEAVTEHFAL